jgi:uncharacterized membrane protein YgdD (TMEM256/DUF423 family)
VSKISAILVIIAGILGGCGVSLAAAAAHVSDSTALRAAAEISMVHGAAILALAAFANQSKSPLIWNLAGIAMALGATLFTGTVALGVLADFRPLPALAPIGGSLTILSWFGVVVAGLREVLTPRS